MAMRPEVKRRSLVLIVFSIVQWFMMLHILNEQLINLSKEGRILAFCGSTFLLCALLFVALFYIVIKGNNPSSE